MMAGSSCWKCGKTAVEADRHLADQRRIQRAETAGARDVAEIGHGLDAIAVCRRAAAVDDDVAQVQKCFALVAAGGAVGHLGEDIAQRDGAVHGVPLLKGEAGHAAGVGQQGEGAGRAIERAADVEQGRVVGQVEGRRPSSWRRR